MNRRGAEQEADIQFSELREHKQILPEQLRDENDFEIVFAQTREGIRNDLESTLDTANLDDVDIIFDLSDEELKVAAVEQAKLNHQAQEIVNSWQRENDEVAEETGLSGNSEVVAGEKNYGKVETESSVKRREYQQKIDDMHEMIADLRPIAQKKIIEAENNNGLISGALADLVEYRQNVDKLKSLKSELAKLDGKELPEDVIDEDSDLVDRILALEKQPAPAKTEKVIPAKERSEDHLQDQVAEIENVQESDGFSPEMVKKEIETVQEVRSKTNSLLNDKEINNFYLRSAFENGTRLEKYLRVLDKYAGLLLEYQTSGSNDSKEELKSSIFAEKNLLNEWHNFYMRLGSEIIDTDYSKESTKIGARLKNIARVAHEVLDRRYW